MPSDREYSPPGPGYDRNGEFGVIGPVSAGVSGVTETMMKRVQEANGQLGSMRIGCDFISCFGLGGASGFRDCGVDMSIAR